MSEPLEILHPEIDPAASAQQRRRAVIALLIACIGWGGSFTWAKSLMAGINIRAGRDESATLGVLMLQGWRFLLAGIVWIALVPGSRSGWTRASLARSLALGLPFTVAMMIQQMGLTRTTEAVSAFLTSLAVLFVPAIVACITHKLPSPSLWLGTALAVCGIYLMTGAAPTGFGTGEVLGLIASVLFSVHIVLINTILSRDTPARMLAGQFIVTGITSVLVTLIVEPAARDPHLLLLPFANDLRLDMSLLIVFATLLAFGLMIFFQPKVEPSRAAIVYLTEPVFAAGFAWVLIGRHLGTTAIAGAGLIIAANALVELWDSRRRSGILRSEAVIGVESQALDRNKAVALHQQDAKITASRG